MAGGMDFQFTIPIGGKKKKQEKRREQFDSVYMDRLLYGGHETSDINKLRDAYVKTGSIPNELETGIRVSKEITPAMEKPLPLGVEGPQERLPPVFGMVPETRAVKLATKPHGSGRTYDSTQLDAIVSGDQQKLIAAFPDGMVPSEALLRASQYQRERAVQGRTENQSSRFDANQTAALRKEFIDRPEVKDFVTVNTQVKAMDSLLKSALAGNMKNKLSLDQGLITMYNKLTDPNSVVRESEYARTPENIPTINRIVGAIAKVEAGGAGLTDDDRAALVLGAKIIANERGRTYQETREGYERISDSINADKSIVTGTLPSFKEHQVGGPDGSGESPFDPDVIAYAKKHGITPGEAQEIKRQRTGGQ